jgi:hypothetical protein
MGPHLHFYGLNTTVSAAVRAPKKIRYKRFRTSGFLKYVRRKIKMLPFRNNALYNHSKKKGHADLIPNPKQTTTLLFSLAKAPQRAAD